MPGVGGGAWTGQTDDDRVDYKKVRMKCSVSLVMIIFSITQLAMVSDDLLKVGN